eukprot:TRINITY_DN34810_c0_g1_i2.p1 TRINITY_DN34810_c0_g1~~TRINITY_DN34810_c0_g1_i2.p1  ORF type:complete len:525 (+),score=126.66 TRINITY_DN34810_c0_g1_i2:342-1916(+)
MREVGVQPSEETYLFVLAAMAKDKNVDRALAMLVEMREKDIPVGTAAYNHCIGACKPEEWQRAIGILEELQAQGLEPDATSFENAAAPCEDAKEWQRSLVLFEEVARRGLTGSSVGHNYALSACRQGKRWQHGFEIMAAMQKLDYDPDFRLKQDLEAQSRGLDRAPLPEPSSRSTPSPDNLWQRKQQLRELREQDKRRQEQRKLDQERMEREAQEALKKQAKQGLKAPLTPEEWAEQNKELIEQRKKEAEQKRKEEEEQAAQRRKEHKERQEQARKQREAERAERESQGDASASSQAPRWEERSVQTGQSGAEKDGGKPQEGARPRNARAEVDMQASGDKRPQGGETRERRQRDGPEDHRRRRPDDRERRVDRKPRPKLRAPGSYVLPVFAQHDRSNHAERQALIKVIARVQEACGAQTDSEFEAEAAEVTGTVRLYASHTPCISCMACFCQFQRLFPKVKLCVDFDDWRDTRRMVEMARREQEHKRRGTTPPNYDCPGLSDMSDEEEPADIPQDQAPRAAAAA